MEFLLYFRGSPLGLKIRIRLYMPKVAKISSLASFPIIGVLRGYVNLT
jgi:hypothetical protein